MRSLFRGFFDVVPLCGPTAQLLWAWGVAVATPPFEAVYKPTTPGKSSYLAHVQCIQTSSFKCVLEPFASTSLRFIGGIAIYSSTSSHPIYSAFQHLLVLRTLFRAVAHKPSLSPALRAIFRCSGSQTLAVRRPQGGGSPPKSFGDSG